MSPQSQSAPRAPITPSSPISQQPTIGLIGMGSMGKMYARLLSAAGWLKINICDRESNYPSLLGEYKDVPGITVLKDGHAVSRTADFLMYSVEAEFIDKIVKEYGPSTKVGCVVSGQTSVKAPEIAAFEEHLPADVQIVTIHSLHGPSVSPEGQPLVLIQHRASDAALHLVEDILRCFKSRYVHLSYEEHDLVTANTQAVTHAAFLSMGTAWCASSSYPWESGYYVGGIETVKVNIMLRIYSNQWHVYAGLAILNPSARAQTHQYAQSATEIYKMMLNGDGDGLRERMFRARDIVFGQRRERPILLSESLLDRFSLGKRRVGDEQDQASNANSHLSLLAMVDCWAHLDINPFHHLALAATPIFRLFLGVAEYLFVSPSSEPRLERAIQAAIQNTAHRSDDLEFVVAARGWSQCISFGSFEVYRRRFEETKKFFETRFEEANRVGGEMIKVVMESEVGREDN